MGKKERDIKKLNKEFYKEYNNENAELEAKKEEIAFRNEMKDTVARDKALEDRERLTRGVVDELTEYCQYQGLDLTFTVENMENYIGFFQGERMQKENDKVEEVKVVKKKKDVFVKHKDDEGVTPVHPRPGTKSGDTEGYTPVVDPEIARMKSYIIRKSGEDDLVQAYLNENYNGLPPHGWTFEKVTSRLREKLIKAAGGSSNYFTVIDRIGNHNYEKTRKFLDL